MAADPHREELLAVIEAVRDRVRARYPSESAAGIPLADLMPAVHAREAAEAKVAAIGSVNPRPPGLVNGLIQAAKKLVARALDWHVREQVEFNRAAIACVETLIGALNDVNRALAALASESEARHQELRQRLDQALEEASEEARQMRDVRTHWAAWRVEWERKLSVNEVQFLRSVADLQTAFQHRVALIESNFRDLVRSQHGDFTTALERATLDIQQRLWRDLERIRADYERLIHEELRLVRQRAAAAAPPPVPAPAPAEPEMDWLRFAARFRGSEERVRELARFYVPHFAGRRAVADLGCGRGEFLEVLREAGIPARGVDVSAEAVALCRAKDLAAEQADLFAWLAALADGALDGIFCGQVVEHLAPPRVPELVRLAAAKLTRGGILAIETPNPECLAIFATHFFLDPTHARPIPSSLLVFYLEECGFGRIDVHRLSPAAESMPALDALPEEFRQAFFGGLDYAVIGRRL